MKIVRCTILIAALGFTAHSFAADYAAPAATAAASAAKPSAGLLNDWLREQSDCFNPWDFGGQSRARLDYRNHFAIPRTVSPQVDFQSTGDPDNTYLLLRERIHAGYGPCSWFKIYGEGQDSSSINDDRDPSPEIDHYVLRQAWASIGDPKQFPLTLKVGRQELAYGDMRLIGINDWNNIGRTFDAAKLHYEQPQFWVDGFFGEPVVPDDHDFDESDSHDRFSGIYASTKTLVPKQETQLYFLARNVDDHSAADQKNKLVPLPSPRNIYTIGARVKSLPGQFGGFDYDAELAGQFGNFRASNTSPSLGQEAFAAHVGAGYTWTKASGTPRLGLEYNYASGDGNSKDGTHGTFGNLFPSNHDFYGYMDFVSWQNIHNFCFNATLMPQKKLTLKLNVNAFWRASEDDYFYRINGTPRTTGGYGLNPSAGSYVGTEIDLTATYAIKPYAKLQAGYGHFFVGDYVINSLSTTTGAADANYVYSQLTLNF